MSTFSSKQKHNLQVLTVGTSEVFSNSIDTSGFESVIASFRATTFAGTPDTTDFVKIVKAQGSTTGAFAGEEVDIAGLQDFEKSDSSSSVAGLTQLSVANSTQVKKTKLADYAIKYRYIRFAFISSDAANTVVFSTVLCDHFNAPVNQ